MAQAEYSPLAPVAAQHFAVARAADRRAGLVAARSVAQLHVSQERVRLEAWEACPALREPGLLLHQETDTLDIAVLVNDHYA